MVNTHKRVQRHVLNAQLELKVQIIEVNVSLVQRVTIHLRGHLNVQNALMVHTHKRVQRHVLNAQLELKVQIIEINV